MKTRLIAFSCILLSAVACTAPQGKKLGANGGGLAPVAAGPTGPATKAANLSLAQKGEMVNLAKDGTITVTLDSSQKDGYMWRLSEIPDPTVLKVVSQNYAPPASGEGRGQETWVFQAVGSGDVDVKMWYGNLREAPLAGNPTYDFVAAVSDQPVQEKKSARKAPKKA
jgi:predicted secreted protein